jgi:hypothetical protein
MGARVVHSGILLALVTQRRDLMTGFRRGTDAFEQVIVELVRALGRSL